MKAAALVLLAAILLPPAAPAETFWNKDKSRSFEGKVVGKEGDKFVFLRSKDGKSFSLTADKLHPDTVALVEKILAAKAAADTPPAPADEPDPEPAPKPKGQVFEYREGGLFFSFLPEKLTPTTWWSSFEGCEFLKENTTFVEFPGGTGYIPEGNAKAYDLKWLDRDWVVVAQMPPIINNTASPEFLVFLPESAEFDEDQTVAFQEEFDAALTKITGVEVNKYSLFNLHPEIRGNEPGGDTPPFLQEEVPGKLLGLGFFRYNYQPKRMVVLYSSPYGRVDLK